MSRDTRTLGVVVLLWGGLTGGAAGQATYGGLTYQPGWQLGSGENVVHEFSWAGIGIDVRRFVSDYLAVGLTSGWNEFTTTTGSVTPAPRRTTHAVPILLGLGVYAGQQGQFQLFVGGGAGVYLFRQRLDSGLVAASATNVHVGLAGEAGFVIPISDDIAGVFQTRYNYALASGETRDHSYLTYGIGLTWTRHP